RINSPLSTRVTVGASVQPKRKSAATNTAPAQTNSATDEGIAAAFACRSDLDSRLADGPGFAERFMFAGYEARVWEAKLPSTQEYRMSPRAATGGTGPHNRVMPAIDNRNRFQQTMSVRRAFGTFLAAAVITLISRTETRADSEIVIAIRYLQAAGTSHSHL